MTETALLYSLSRWRAMRFLVLIAMSALLSFGAAFVTADKSGPLETGIGTFALTITIGAAIMSVVVTRNTFAASAILVISVVLALCGSFLPYYLGIRGLTEEDYGHADTRGGYVLLIGVVYGSVIGACIGVVVGLGTLAGCAVVRLARKPR